MFPTLQATAPAAIELSFLEALSDTNDARWKEIVRYRNYHEGLHDVYLTARLRQFLGLPAAEATAGRTTAFRMNVCRIVVEAVLERLILDRFDCGDDLLKEWAAAVASANRLALRASDVHELAVRDGEGFLLVDWDTDRQRIRFTPHPVYTSTAVDGGDGFGCLMVYPDGDVSQPALYAIKRWVELVANELPRQRATYYYPDRIEKRVYTAGGWQPIMDDDDMAWPIPWLNGRGEPLGIPVVHFQNKSLRGEAADAIPLQDLLNKTVVDLAAAADVTAFRIFVALGWYPTTDGEAPAEDGSNLLTLEPGQILGTTAKPGEASFTVVDGADLSSLRELVGDWVLDIAVVTNTPASRFQTTKAIAAEGTLKQQEEPLMAKVRSKQMIFGVAWETALDLGRRIENVFGSAGLNEAEPFIPVWRDAQTRTDDQRQAEWKVKRELGIPLRFLWAEIGYSAEQIEAMLNDPETRATTFVDPL